MWIKTSDSSDLFQELIYRHLLAKLHIPHLKLPKLCGIASCTYNHEPLYIVFLEPFPGRSLNECYFKGGSSSLGEEAFEKLGQLLSSFHHANAHHTAPSPIITSFLRARAKEYLEEAADNDQPLTMFDWSSFPKKGLSHFDSLLEKLSTQKIKHSYSLGSAGILFELYYDHHSHDFYIKDFRGDTPSFSKSMKPFYPASLDYLQFLECLSKQGTSDYEDKSYPLRIVKAFERGYQAEEPHDPSSIESDLFNTLKAIENVWFYEEDEYEYFQSHPTPDDKIDFEKIFWLKEKLEHSAE